uniref:adenosine kinase n=1 Tax=Glossina austeni TaxID=7395 RepID=A0A1A9V295_GLOAU
MERLRENLVVSLGNPLLDIIATVDSEFLEKYNLRPDNAVLMKDEHMSLYKELEEKYNPDYIAGGSAQNTLRVCQWILQKPKIVTFFGCVGKDDYANILQEKATQDGLNVFYQYAIDAPTGTCAVLISNSHRSLCARLAAAIEFKIEHLQKPHNRELWENARYFYTTGFFLAINPPAVMQIARHAYDSNGTVMMNLSASFVMQEFKEALMAVMPYVKVLFGNGEEAKAFARVHNWETKDLKVIGLRLVALDKENCEGERIVIITQASLPVLAFQGCTIKEYPVPKVNPEQVVDTTAAGDAFCGGFLAQYIQNKNLDVCVHCGIWAASQIIQHNGCTFEGKPTFREVRHLHIKPFRTLGSFDFDAGDHILVGSRNVFKVEEEEEDETTSLRNNNWSPERSLLKHRAKFQVISNKCDRPSSYGSGNSRQLNNAAIITGTVHRSADNHMTTMGIRGLQVSIK